MALKSPKAKGSAGELEMIALLTTWGRQAGIRLQLERNLEQVRKGGSDINGVPGLEIEVKRVEDNAINQWWAQVCTAAAKQGTTPFLAHRRNRQPWRFRVQAWVWPCRSRHLFIDLELSEAKEWFIAYLKENEHDGTN